MKLRYRNCTLARCAGSENSAALPCLPLIFTEILNDEWLNIVDRKESLAGSMDGKASQIANYPFAPKLFSNSGSSAAATHEMRNEVLAGGKELRNVPPYKERITRVPDKEDS